MSNNKQSSIEYFKTQIVDIVEDYKDGIITLNEYIIHINSTFEQAKSMHKYEIITTHLNAQTFNGTMLYNAEQYYNETFGGNQ